MKPLTLIGSLLLAFLALADPAASQVETYFLDVPAYRLDTDGVRIIAGAPAGNGFTNSYVTILGQDGDGWAEEARLERTDTPTNFGGSVAIQGESALIADYWDAEACGGATSCITEGAVYHFVRQPDGQWREEQKLLPVRTASGDSRVDFGLDVAMDGDWALVMSQVYPDSYSPRALYVYFYERTDDGWVWRQETTARVQARSDWADIAIDGERALIGADMYHLEDGEWIQKQTLTPSIGGLARYGYAVALRGDWAAVTALSYEHPEGGHAAVFQREGDTWTERAIVTGDPIRTSRFGGAVAIEDGVLLVSDATDDVGGNPSGVAYVFEAGDGTWPMTALLESSRGWLGWTLELVDGQPLLGGSGVFAFDLDMSTLSPAPLSPVNETEVTDGDLTLSWSPVPDATSYRVQVWTIECCGNGGRIYEELNIEGTSVTLGDFPTSSRWGRIYDGIELGWRVAANVPAGAGPFSEPASMRYVAPPIVVDSEDSERLAFEVSPAYPTPSRGDVVIPITLQSAEVVDVRVFDLLGREVLDHQTAYAAGEQRISLDAGTLPDGHYLCRITAGVDAVTVPIVIAR
ncbi:T9SS type A sorting domain-containing protein [Rubrivirga sp.]|uniref:T9SS type A sorting domain-containing protein n=1 Tax=Rubrivirga sp. TaxID=1885344 RepID=UPI003C72D0B8